MGKEQMQSQYEGKFFENPVGELRLGRRAKAKLVKMKVKTLRDLLVCDEREMALRLGMKTMRQIKDRLRALRVEGDTGLGLLGGGDATVADDCVGRGLHEHHAAIHADLWQGALGQVECSLLGAPPQSSD